MKEIDEYMARMRDAVKNKTVDDEDKRVFSSSIWTRV